MDAKEKQIKKDLIATTKAVKKKFHQLQSDNLWLDEHLEKQYKPITKSLKTIIKRQKLSEHLAEGKVNADFSNDETYDNESEHDYSEVEDENFEDAKDEIIDTPKKIKKRIPKKIKFEEEEEERIDLDKFYDVLLTSASDTQFGVRRSGKYLRIGKYIVKFHEKFLHIRKQKFPITNGLLNLLFYKRPPGGYTTDDLEQYKNILILTDAHMKFFDGDAKVRKSNRTNKYRNIISPLLRSGSGIKTDFMSVNSNSIDYTYWDNPNELVDRLRLLVSSSSAGHTGHNNEIISILEELREAKIIQ